VEYEIISKNSSGNYKLGVKGNIDEIKLWLEELCVVAGFSKSGYYYSQLKNNFDTLEDRIKPFEFSFGINHRLWITGKSIVYMPPSSASNSRKEIYFDDFKIFYFDRIMKNIEKRDSDNLDIVQNI